MNTLLALGCGWLASIITAAAGTYVLGGNPGHLVTLLVCLVGFSVTFGLLRETP